MKRQLTTCRVWHDGVAAISQALGSEYVSPYGEYLHSGWAAAHVVTYNIDKDFISW